MRGLSYKFALYCEVYLINHNVSSGHATSQKRDDIDKLAIGRYNNIMKGGVILMSEFDTRERELDKYRGFPVVKHNDIIQKARFNLTTQEQKIILFLISKINSTGEDLPDLWFDIKEFCEVCDINYHGNYNFLRNSIKSLADKSIWVKQDVIYNGKIEEEESLLRWFHDVYVYSRSGKIKVMFHDKMKPYLIGLIKNFTRYELLNILGMKSQYAIRLYELFKSYAFKNKISISLDDLKRMLMAEKLYSNFFDFRKNVLNIAINEINRVSDINVSWEVSGRKGKKVTELVFRIKEKTSHEKLIALEQTKDVVMPWVQEKLDLTGGENEND